MCVFGGGGEEKYGQRQASRDRLTDRQAERQTDRLTEIDRDREAD